MASGDFDPYSVHEQVREQGWDFVADIRGRADLHDPVFDSAPKLYYLETCVWDLVTLVSAATYHAGRVLDEIARVEKDLISEQAAALKKAPDQVKDMLSAFGQALAKTSIQVEAGDDEPEEFSGTARVTVESGPVLFEFNAFLISARSALDYLARVLGVYIKGAEFRSIHKLNNWLGKNHPDTVLAEFLAAEWNDWIATLKSYRDAVAHNVVLNLTASTETSFDDSPRPAWTDRLPPSDNLIGFHIYRTAPTFRYKVVGMEDVFDGELPVIETEAIMNIELPDGEQTTIRHKWKEVDTAQVIPLDEYVEHTLESIERLVREAFALLLSQKGQFIL